MNVTGTEDRTTRVGIPPDVARPFEVYVNGVLQQEGSDYRVESGALVFDRELRSEGRLGFWRWLSMRSASPALSEERLGRRRLFA